MTKEHQIPAAESGVPQNQWHHVHFLTPLMETWQFIAALVAFATVQNIEAVLALREAIGDGSINLASSILLIVGGVLLVLFLIVAYTFLVWKRMTFAIGDEAVWLRKGLLMRSQRHARFDRIQAVDIVHPFLGRIFGLGKLHIEVAGGAKSNVEIGYLKTSDLEALRLRIGALAASGANLTIPEASTATSGVEPSLVPDQAQTPDTPPTIRMEERPLYAVSLGRQIHALALSAEFIIPMFMVVGFIAIMFVGFLITGEWGFLGGVLGFAPMLVGIGGYMWTQINKSFGFRAFVTQDGIRLQRGLLETRSQTIPPKRVHAVEVSQSILWRKKGWYKVRILQAGYVGEEQKENNDILLPVGTTYEAQLAMWLVAPDLGVDTPLELIGAALHGDNKHPDPYFQGVKRQVRWLDWFSWKRRAYALTRTAVITRDGWLTHRAIVIPLERMQSLSLRQGPLQKRLDVATLHIETVPGRMNTRARHMDARCAQKLIPSLLRLAAYHRSLEEPQPWVQRVSSNLTPFGAQSTAQEGQV